jgi:hypothetical protein
MIQEPESGEIVRTGRDAAEYARPERRERFVDDPRKKSVMLAILLSAMPGLGQVYVGYYNLAFRNILVVCGLSALLGTNAVHHLEPVVGLFLVFFWLYNVVDAGRRASFYNQALAGIRPMDLPEDMKVPQAFGSLAGGVLLVAVGLTLFAHTMFGVSIDWIAQWWPLLLVAAGAWLIYQDRFAKSAARPGTPGDGNPLS